LASGKKVPYGQAGKAKDGGPRVRPGTKKGDAYCARSDGQMKKHPKAAANPNSPHVVTVRRERGRSVASKFKPCAGCPTPSLCKARGKCRAKKRGKRYVK